MTVIGIDKLGSAIALEYCKFITSQKMGTKMSSEVTGAGAIDAPKKCILCLRYNKENIINNTGTHSPTHSPTHSLTYSLTHSASKLETEEPSPNCDEEVSNELVKLANSYIQDNDLTAKKDKYKVYIVSENIDTIDSIGKQIMTAIQAV